MLIIASTDLQKEIVEGGRVSHTPKTGSLVFVLSPTAFVSEIKLFCSIQ